jgi:hypothetical protein
LCSNQKITYIQVLQTMPGLSLCFPLKFLQQIGKQKVKNIARGFGKSDEAGRFAERRVHLDCNMALMSKKILILLVLQLSWLNALPFSGRLLTPYFEAIKYYDYVVKGKVINNKEIIGYNFKIVELQVVIIDKIGQKIEDTVWIKPSIAEGAYPNFNYEELSGQYYFGLKRKDNHLYYDPSDLYCLLKINDGTVSALFTSFDVFFNKLLHLHTLRKMKIEKFEGKLRRKRLE